MGKGGQTAPAKGISTSRPTSATNHGTNKSGNNVWHSPYDPQDPNAPTLPTKGEVKAIIPPNCFERSLVRSLGFLLRDTIMAAALVCVTKKCLSTDLPENLLSVEALGWASGWTFYAFWMGTICTGHWVLAHECGHGAFSANQTVNDIVGYIFHQALLVPYFSWQYTHAKHHRRTNHHTDGESHVPLRANNFDGKPSFYGVAIREAIDESGAFGPLSLVIGRSMLGVYAYEILGDGGCAAWQIFLHLVLGWPIYLLGLASTGRLNYDGEQKTGILDHFRPTSKMFPPKLFYKVAASTAGIVGLLGYLLKLSLDHGFRTVFLWYGFPYLFVNGWLVTYTWLQHTDPSVPHYGLEDWTWVKGALATIDRPYGIFDFFHHKIGSTHVAHHFFHEMPFYKADEATAAIKAFLEPKGLYNYDPTPFYIAMWRIAKTCHHVDTLEGIQYYKSIIPEVSDDNKKKSE